MTDGELLPSPRLLKRLGVDMATIRRNVRHDEIPVVCVPGARRGPAAWVDDPKGWWQ